VILDHQSVGILQLQTRSLKEMYMAKLQAAQATLAMKLVSTARKEAEALVAQLQALAKCVCQWSHCPSSQTTAVYLHTFTDDHCSTSVCCAADHGSGKQAEHLLNTWLYQPGSGCRFEGVVCWCCWWCGVCVASGSWGSSPANSVSLLR
jgi:hypothetical protein